MADAGARSQGAMAGSAIAAGVGVPAAILLCWMVAAGWATSRQNIGSSAGSLVNSAISDC